MSIIQPVGSRVVSAAWGPVAAQITMPDTRSTAGILQYVDMRKSAQRIAEELIRHELMQKTPVILAQYERPTYGESADTITFYFTPAQGQPGHDPRASNRA